MTLLDEYKQGKRLYKYALPNGLEVPFRLLSWGDFTIYSSALERKSVPSGVIESAICSQCILHEHILEQLYELPAGGLSTIANIIMHMSGPSGVEQFNNSLNQARGLVDTVNSQMIMIICRAFPSYKPEDLLTMSWDDLLLRTAQAERILMTRQPPELAEPLKLLTEAEVAKRQKKLKFDPSDLVKDARAHQHPDVLGRQETNDPVDIQREMQRRKVQEVQSRVRRMRQS